MDTSGKWQHLKNPSASCKWSLYKPKTTTLQAFCCRYVKLNYSITLSSKYNSVHSLIMHIISWTSHLIATSQQKFNEMSSSYPRWNEQYFFSKQLLILGKRSRPKPKSDSKKWALNWCKQLHFLWTLTSNVLWDVPVLLFWQEFLFRELFWRVLISSAAFTPPFCAYLIFAEFTNLHVEIDSICNEKKKQRELFLGPGNSPFFGNGHQMLSSLWHPCQFWLLKLPHPCQNPIFRLFGAARNWVIRGNPCLFDQANVITKCQ